MLVAAHPNGTIAGFIDFGPPVLNVEGFDTQVYSFYMSPAFQRLGLGQRLFDRCMLDIGSAGSRSVCLDSLAVSPYRRFYKRAGGREIGRDKHKLGDEDFETVIYGWQEIGEMPETEKYEEQI